MMSPISTWGVSRLTPSLVSPKACFTCTVASSLRQCAIVQTILWKASMLLRSLRRIEVHVS